MKKRIHELKMTQWRTVHKTDAYGERYREQEEWEVSYLVRPVTTGKRFAHYLIDLTAIWVIHFGISLLLTYSLGYVPELSVPFVPSFFFFVGDLIFASVLLVYYGFFEISFQKTPGKMITKTIVINEFAEKPEFPEMILRTLCRLIPFEALSCLGENSRDWHDRLSRTWVISEFELKKIQQLQQENLSEEAAEASVNY